MTKYKNVSNTSLGEMLLRKIGTVLYMTYIAYQVMSVILFSPYIHLYNNRLSLYW